MSYLGYDASARSAGWMDSDRDDDLDAGDFDGVEQMTLREAQVRPELALNIGRALKQTTPRDYWKPERVPLHLAGRVNNWKRGGGVVAVNRQPRKITRGPIPNAPSPPRRPAAATAASRAPGALSSRTPSARAPPQQRQRRGPTAEPRLVLHAAGDDTRTASAALAAARALTPPRLRGEERAPTTAMAEVPATPRTAARRDARRQKRLVRRQRRKGARKSTKPMHHLDGGTRGPAIDGPARGALEAALRERRPQSALQGATRTVSPAKAAAAALRATAGTFIDDWLPLPTGRKSGRRGAQAASQRASSRTIFDVPAPEIGLTPLAARGSLAHRRPLTRGAAGMPKRPSDPIRFSMGSGIEGAVPEPHDEMIARAAKKRRAAQEAAALVGGSEGTSFVRMEYDEKRDRWHATQSNPNLTTNWPLAVGKVAVTVVGAEEFQGIVASPNPRKKSSTIAAKSATPSGRGGRPRTAPHAKAWGAPPAPRRSATPRAGSKAVQNPAITMKPPPPWANKHELERWAAHLQSVLPDQREVIEEARLKEEMEVRKRAEKREQARRKTRKLRALTPAGAKAKKAGTMRGAIAKPLHTTGRALGRTAPLAGAGAIASKQQQQQLSSTAVDMIPAPGSAPATDFTLRRDKGVAEAKDDAAATEEEVGELSSVDDAAFVEADSEELALREAAGEMKAQLKGLLAQSQAHAQNPTADPDFLRKFNELSMSYRANTVQLAAMTQRRGSRALSATASAQPRQAHAPGVESDAVGADVGADAGAKEEDARANDSGNAVDAEGGDANSPANEIDAAASAQSSEEAEPKTVEGGESSVDVVQTTMVEAAAAGSTVLEVESNAGWCPGMMAILNRGESTEETVEVAGLGSLILFAPLAYNHAIGETVVCIDDAAKVNDYEASSGAVEKPPSRAGRNLAAALDYGESNAPSEKSESESEHDNGSESEPETAFDMETALHVAREPVVPLPSLHELTSMPTLTGLADRVRAAAVRSGLSPRNGRQTERQQRWHANSVERTTKKTQQQKKLTLKRMRARDADRKAKKEAEAKLIAALEDGSAITQRFSARPVPSAVTDVGRYDRILLRSEKKREKEHEKRVAELKGGQASFTGLEKRRLEIERRKEHREARKLAQQKVRALEERQLEAVRVRKREKLIAGSGKKNTASLKEEMERSDEERRIRCELRASDVMAASRMPARMEEHAKKMALEKTRREKQGGRAGGSGNAISSKEREMRQRRQLEGERILRRDALEANGDEAARKAHAAAFPDAPSFLVPNSDRMVKEAKRNKQRDQRLALQAGKEDANSR